MTLLLLFLGGCGVVAAYVVTLSLCYAASRADAWLEEQASGMAQDVTAPTMSGDVVREELSYSTEAPSHLVH